MPRTLGLNRREDLACEIDDEIRNEYQLGVRHRLQLLIANTTHICSIDPHLLFLGPFRLPRTHRNPSRKTNAL
jgi:hypothetical protein